MPGLALQVPGGVTGFLPMAQAAGFVASRDDRTKTTEFFEEMRIGVLLGLHPDLRDSGGSSP
jgi:hypothetical protein